MCVSWCVYCCACCFVAGALVPGLSLRAEDPEGVRLVGGGAGRVTLSIVSLTPKQFESPFSVLQTHTGDNSSAPQANTVFMHMSLLRHELVMQHSVPTTVAPTLMHHCHLLCGSLSQMQPNQACHACHQCR